MVIVLTICEKLYAYSFKYCNCEWYGTNDYKVNYTKEKNKGHNETCWNHKTYYEVVCPGDKVVVQFKAEVSLRDCEDYDHRSQSSNEDRNTFIYSTKCCNVCIK